MPYSDPERRRTYQREYHARYWQEHHADPEWREVRRARSRAWQRQNRELASRYSRAYVRQRRLDVILQLGGKCERCGYSACLAGLDMHHRDPTTKRKANRDWYRADFKVTDVMLLCRNCHAELEHKAHSDTEIHPVMAFGQVA